MLEVKQVNDSLIELTGRFDASQVETAEAVLDHVQTDFTLDCQKLEYISSAGIGVLLGTFKRLHETGNAFTMINVNPQIRQVFRYAGLDKVFSIQES